MKEITITFPDEITIRYPSGTPLYKIAEDYQQKMKHNIIGAKINNEITPMHTNLTKNASVSFLDILNPYGYRMYQAALKFIFEVAVKETFESVEVHFLHSVPKGIMCEIEGITLEKEDINKMKEAMARIIHNDEKIVKYNVEKKEAIRYFNAHNQKEKAKNVHNTNNDIVSFYKLKNIYNYYYTDMPYSTKNINKFDLKFLGDNRIVLVYPSSRTEGLVPEYVHYEKIIETFLEGQNWLKKMNTPYLSNLNEEVSNSEIEEFINSCELIFNESIAKLASTIYEKKEVKIVLISGPSSTGKTTTTKRLSSYLRALGYNTIPISVDDYYKDRENTPKNELGEYDFESLNAIDTEMFNQDLTDLLNGKSVHLPSYDFVIQKKNRRSNSVRMQENSILLIEGLHGLNEELTSAIDEKYKYKIYLSPFIPLGIDRHNYISTVDLRLLRRIVRDNRTRGTNVSKTIELWQSVREGEEKYIFPFIHQADCIINTAYAFEVGVLKVFVEPLLYSVGLDSPYYEEARRLIDSLRGFYPIPSEYISKDSILREFIG